MVHKHKVEIDTLNEATSIHEDYAAYWEARATRADQKKDISDAVVTEQRETITSLEKKAAKKHELVTTVLALQDALKKENRKLKEQISKQDPPSLDLIQSLLNLQESMRKENDQLKKLLARKPDNRDSASQDTKRNLVQEFRPPKTKRSRQAGDTPEVVKRHQSREAAESIDGLPILVSSDSEADSDSEPERPQRPRTQELPKTPLQVREMRKELQELKEQIHANNTAANNASTTIPTGKEVYLSVTDGTQETPSERNLKQWDNDLRNWEFKMPQRMSKDLVSIRFLCQK
jgi:hypothetical protein